MLALALAFAGFPVLPYVRKPPKWGAVLSSMVSALRPSTTSTPVTSAPRPRPGTHPASAGSPVPPSSLAVLQRVCQRQGTLVIGISLRGRGYRTRGVYRVGPGPQDRSRSTGSTLGYPHGRVGFKVGKAHRDWLDLPRGVAFVVAKKQKYLLCGLDPQQLGQVARRLQAFRPQNPYVGSGFLLQRR